MIAKQAHRYLRGPAKNKMKINPGKAAQVTSFVEIPLGNEAEKGRQSLSGLLLKYGNAVVAAATDFQKYVRLSSTEAEYVVLSEAAKTILWFRDVLHELCIEQKSTKIHQDSSRCIECATGGAGRRLYKRDLIDGEHRYMKSLVKEFQITLVPIRMNEMRTDLLTKAVLPGCLSRAPTPAEFVV